MNLLKYLKTEEIASLTNGDEEARTEAERRFSSIFKQRTRDEWSRILMKKETCVTPVPDISEVLRNPWIKVVYDNESKVLTVPVRVENIKKQKIKKAPLIGENTDAVLSSIGYSEKKIIYLKNEGVIK
jgi:crotonobetainyl-CoA:carnitine CoA-transferase CaiB-like acyl-CoA transferase